MRVILCFILFVNLTGCKQISKPHIDFASVDKISVSYYGFGSKPKLHESVVNLAEKHCDRYNKKSTYKGVKFVYVFSTLENHFFSCDEI